MVFNQNLCLSVSGIIEVQSIWEHGFSSSRQPGVIWRFLIQIPAMLPEGGTSVFLRMCGNVCVMVGTTQSTVKRMH